MAAMRNDAQTRRLFQTVAGMLPCRALLFKQGKSLSPQCLLCGGQSETVAHIQCWCPSLRQARIAAHHAIAALIFNTLQRHSIGRWQLLVETPVSSLRAAEIPLDMYDIWNWMIDELEESELEADGLGGQQVLARLRQDAWAISWSSWQILLLELTRARMIGIRSGLGLPTNPKEGGTRGYEKGCRAYCQLDGVWKQFS